MPAASSTPASDSEATPKPKRYRVGRSRTGLGLFATQAIKKGEKVIRYKGPLLDARNKDDDGVENKYLFRINGRWTIDGSVRTNLARYVNHSCRGNAESEVDPRKRRVTIRAIRNIAPGDEITYDYGTEYFKMFLEPIGCKCEACEKKRARKLAKEQGGTAAALKTSETVVKSATKAKTIKANIAKAKTTKAKTTKAKTTKAKTTKSKTATAASKKTVSKKTVSKKAVPKKAVPKKVSPKTTAPKKVNKAASAAA